MAVGRPDHKIIEGIAGVQPAALMRVEGALWWYRYAFRHRDSRLWRLPAYLQEYRGLAFGDAAEGLRKSEFIVFLDPFAEKYIGGFNGYRLFRLAFALQGRYPGLKDRLAELFPQRIPNGIPYKRMVLCVHVHRIHSLSTN